MTWERRKRGIEMGRCISCDSDLQVKLLTRGRFAVYVCSNTRCAYAKRGMRRSSELYIKRPDTPKG